MRIGAIWFFVPIYGVSAYIWGDLAGMAIMAVMNLIYIARCTAMPFELGKWILSPAMPGVAFVVVGKMLLATSFCKTLLGFAGALGLCGIAALATYGMLGVFGKKEIF